jgi:BirA family biotin operon repressor/biotin-[acetyl-CoA-carboxylase] ligase
VSVVQKTASTNSDLLAAIRAGRFRAPALLVAEHQTAGRGRLGRVWNSAAGASLTVSFALPIDRPMSALDGVTLACGLAACDAIAVHGVEARLKWPNDLLVDGRKLAGILVEVVPVAQGTVLIVGVGVNVGPGDGPLSKGLTAIDLKTAGGSALDRNRLAAGLGRALEARLAAFESSGFASCVDEWNGRDAFRDQAVTLQAGSDPCITGIERGVDVGGALLVDTPDQGRRRIVSGDLSLRLAMAR